MTTHHEKIPRFRCGYFRPCVCVPLFGPGGPVFKCAQLFPFELDDATSRGKIPCFCCGYFWLMCVCNATRQESCENSAFSLRLFPACMCVCVCVCVCMCCDARCDSRVKIPCFHCGYFRLMCVFVCSAFCLDRAGPALRCSSIVGISESETECVPCCQLPHFATLIFGYS